MHPVADSYLAKAQETAWTGTPFMLKQMIYDAYPQEICFNQYYLLR